MCLGLLLTLNLPPEWFWESHRMLEIKSGWPHAKQMPFSLYYYFDPNYLFLTHMKIIRMD